MKVIDIIFILTDFQSRNSLEGSNADLQHYLGFEKNINLSLTVSLLRRFDTLKVDPRGALTTLTEEICIISALNWT